MSDAINPITQSPGNGFRIHLDQLDAIAKQQDVTNKIPDEQALEAQAPESGSDTVRITKSASLFANSGLDKQESVFRSSGDRIEFNLKFDTDSYDSITLKGTYNPDGGNLNVSASFNFKDTAEIDGQEQDVSYNARVKIDLSNVGRATFERLDSAGGQLERIIDGTLAQLKEAAQSRMHPPGSVVIQLDSIAEMFATQKGGVFQRVSRSMLVLNNSMARALNGEAAVDQILPKNLERSSDGPESLQVNDFTFQLTDVTGQAPKLPGQMTGQEAAPPPIATASSNPAPSVAPSTQTSSTRVMPVGAGTGSGSGAGGTSGGEGGATSSGGGSAGGGSGSAL